MTAHLNAFAIYAGLFGLMYIWIMGSIVGLRQKHKISYGDGGNLNLLKAMRGHANFTETVPLGLILLLITAFMQPPLWVVHVLCIIFVVLRFAHALRFLYGGPDWLRVGAAAGTNILLGTVSIGLVLHALL
jgi:uncharacterized membrane protein YecN with MAPEG domain